MNVHVTKQDIAKGKPRDCGKCPVARAIRRKSHRKVWADLDIIMIAHREFHTPAIVTRFMSRFDYGKPVKPFSFQLEARS